VRAVADYIYTGSYYTSTAQRASSGPDYDPGKSMAGDTEVRAAGFINLRLALEDIAVGHDGRAEVSLWLRNLTDKNPINN